METETDKGDTRQPARPEMSQREFLDKVENWLSLVEKEHCGHFNQLEQRVQALEAERDAIFELNLARRLQFEKGRTMSIDEVAEDPLYRLRRLLPED